MCSVRPLLDAHVDSNLPIVVSLDYDHVHCIGFNIAWNI